MFKYRYVLISSLALSLVGCNREAEREPAAADADARGASSPDAVPDDATTNVDPSTGGTIGRAGDIPGPGGGGFGGYAGGVGRSANDGTAAPSAIGAQ